MSLTTARTTIEVHLGSDEWAASLRADAASGLTARPRTLPPTWLYDELGCRLYDAITQVPEYYPARTEHRILHDRAGDAARLSGADTLVEIGAGTAEKTRVLLDALAAAGTLRRYVPFDVAEGTLRATAEQVTAEYPGVEVTGVVGDFRRHLGVLPGGGRRLFAFLGGTIGNLDPAERAGLLAALAATLAPGDALLLGTDLVKDRGRLVAAYDDAAGVTAAFNKNVLSVLNRELGATFDLDAFEHVARFDEAGSRIEMHLRAVRPTTATIAALETTVSLQAGESIRTEISTKFRPEQVAGELSAAGLRLLRWWTDPAGDFGLSLSVR